MPDATIRVRRFRKRQRQGRGAWLDRHWHRAAVRHPTNWPRAATIDKAAAAMAGEPLNPAPQGQGAENSELVDFWNASFDAQDSTFHDPCQSRFIEACETGRDRRLRVLRRPHQQDAVTIAGGETERRLLVVARCDTKNDTDQKKQEVTKKLGVSDPNRVVVVKGSAKSFLSQSELVKVLFGNLPESPDSPF